MTTLFTSKSLPEAISSLFSQNNYKVEGPIQIRGAEIDLVARPKADPFGTPIYIEATIEHVDNDKYGKDTLLWNAITALFSEEQDPVRSCLQVLTGSGIACSDISISRLIVSPPSHPTCLDGADFSRCDLISVDFSNGRYQRTDFSEGWLDGANYAGADLTEAKFNGCALIDVDFSGAILSRSEFHRIEESSTIIIEGTNPVEQKSVLQGKTAIGYLAFHGAKTDPIPPFFVYKHHPKFPIVQKICGKLSEDAVRQRRGLEQRGAARQDTGFARKFVAFLETQEFIETKGRPDLVHVTAKGREVFGQVSQGDALPEAIVSFLREPT